MILICALFLVITETEGTPRPGAVRPSDVDVYPEPFKNFVPFGQIYKEGFWDPNGHMKQPIDILELQMAKPDKREGLNQLIRNGKTYLIKSDKPSVFLNPRDAYMAEHEIDQNKRKDEDEVTVVNMTRPLWLDLTAALQRNALSPTTRKTVFPKRHNKGIVDEVIPMQSDNDPNKKEYFTADSYDLVSWRKQQQVNWTTCNDFAIGASFHPKDVVDIDWVPFYIWSNRRKTFCDVHRFSYPTVKLVKHFRDTYGSKLTKKVDWNQPTLFMNGTGEWLLIAADRNGLFHAIPRHSTADFIKTNPVKFPVATIRLKVMDPYLAYMLCDEFYAAIMAAAGTEPPNDKDKELEASALGFRGVGAPITRDLEYEIKMNKMLAEDAAQRERRKFVDITYK
ncbi:hypothetical protein K1T71_011219 [Dendrolimus kikuchii]|uniref:Uncharacterized protein n=1 Tax=Dendrolimus kikuchii TaxID=765133 RepID=A0ACC1CN60_9NEOP|nr:hypothetical protein K1T71_011219 [Dendrolimus kikuchii]